MEPEDQPLAHAHVHARRTSFVNAFSSLTVQLTTLVMLVGLVLWTMLFTSYAPVHDTLHALRHALYLIPCH